jgi:hypothetical protein
MATNRTYVYEGSGGITLGGSAKVEFVPYPDSLLKNAGALCDGGHYGMAVIGAHMACEVAVQGVLFQAWAAKNLPSVGAAVDDLFSGYNLGNDRIRDLYVALTGKEVQKQKFWGPFKESSVLRNHIVHGGVTVKENDARKSLAAAADLLQFLK